MEEEEEEEKEKGITLEWIQNAQINFKNVVKLNPQLAAHPIFRLASEQLHNGLGKHSVQDL